MKTRGSEIFRDQLIERRDFAALASATVRIPGIGAPPQRGTYYASPELQRLIDSTPRDQLGDRFGEFAGTIDDSALPGPDSLVVITGGEEAELRRGGNASLVSDFTSNPYGGSGASYTTVLIIGAIAVFFPVLLLISIVTGLGAAQRRERFATLRLIGASPRTVSQHRRRRSCHPQPDRCNGGCTGGCFAEPRHRANTGQREPDVRSRPSARLVCGIHGGGGGGGGLRAGGSSPNSPGRRRAAGSQQGGAREKANSLANCAAGVGARVHGLGSGPHSRSGIPAAMA